LLRIVRNEPIFVNVQLPVMNCRIWDEKSGFVSGSGKKGPDTDQQH
jgi:hypothetical protein